MRRVVFLSHTEAGGVFRVGSHHLARELSRAGVEVHHVPPPTQSCMQSRDYEKGAEPLLDEGSLRTPTASGTWFRAQCCQSQSQVGGVRCDAR